MSTAGTSNFVSLYSSRAHIFQIDKETRNRWIEKGNQAIPISIIAIIDQAHDSVEPKLRRDLKIVATNEAGKTVLDVVISPKTVFNKRSQKFGQWTDPVSGEVYGLGFSSEAELIEFNNTFQQLQRDILTSSPNGTSSAVPPEKTVSSSWTQQNLQQQQHHHHTNQQQYNDANTTSETIARPAQTNVSSHNPSNQQYSSTLAHQNSQQTQEVGRSSGVNSVGYKSNIQTNGNNDSSNQYPRSQSMFGLQANKNSSLANRDGNRSLLSSGPKSTPEPEASSLSQGDWYIRDQLKYENERLKQALEESSKNAQVWNKELLNLRTNNVKLTQALQESKSHVEEWERELINLRGENKDLKMRLSVLESQNGHDRNGDSLNNYKSYVESYRNELKKKEIEIENMQKAMEKLELKASEASLHQDGQQIGEVDPDNVVLNSHQKQKFDVINAKLEAKLSELVNVQKEYSQLLDNLYRRNHAY